MLLSSFSNKVCLFTVQIRTAQHHNKSPELIFMKKALISGTRTHRQESSFSEEECLSENLLYLFP